MGRTRYLLKKFLSGVVVRKPEQPYQFKRNVEPESGTLATCEIVWNGPDSTQQNHRWIQAYS